MIADPRKTQDWQIAELAEKSMAPIQTVAEKTGLLPDEIIKLGRNLCKVDYAKATERLADKSNPRTKYIDVTAITPTPLGEGKTTTVIGLIQGLSKLGKKVSGAIRQPSGGPTFNIKGSAAGGGLAQCIPLVPFSMGFTGDIERITNAHNLAMVALTARMQHENNYDDARLEKSNLKRLDIDPENIQLRWVIDFCAQSLRNIRIGMGGKMDGFEMDSGFDIAVSSELMSILALSNDLKDMRQRIGKIVAAYDKNGNEVTCADLEVDGAMAAWMTDTINPSLIQTIEGQPVFVHAGPFANISVGQSSIIADKLASKLSDYHVTESGFGTDIGFEKFWNLKCRLSGLRPDAVVIVATIRALKMHGGGSAVIGGKSLAYEYSHENLELLENGCANLIAHIEIVKKSGVKPVVCINHFDSDTQAEISLVKKISQSCGAEFACSQHWLKGGEGAIDLAEKVIHACDQPNNFNFLYDQHLPLREKIKLIAKDIYGAEDVAYTTIAEEKAKKIEQRSDLKDFGTCMVKTHLSLSHDPNLKGRPKNWILPIRDILLYKGAGLIVPVAGTIKLMPGTASNPAFRKMDIDVETGKVRGLF